MGKKKKKFIDMKKAATFVLLSRDSYDHLYTQGPVNDRVFVRVDNNPVSIRGMSEDDEFEDSNRNDPSSMLNNASNDVVFGDRLGAQTAYLSDNVRREILELGLPDDGYDYLTHLREIRNTGAGSAYYENSKANLRGVPGDVKAYDATRVQVASVSEETVDTSPKTLYRVAQETVNVTVQKVVDPEIAALLDESESEFGSDIDELEEDFIVKANILEETEDALPVKILPSVSQPQDEIPNKSHSLISHGLSNDVHSYMFGRREERLL